MVTMPCASEGDLEEIPMEGDSGPRKRALSMSSDSREIDIWAFVSLSRRRLVLRAPRKLQCPLLGG